MITELEWNELIKAGIITKEQNIEMTIKRHLKWIAEAKIKDPSQSIRLLRLLNIEEDIIQNVIRSGQDKILKELDVVFEEATGHSLLCL